METQLINAAYERSSLRSIADNFGLQFGQLNARLGYRGRNCQHPLFRYVPAGEYHERLRLAGRARLDRSGVGASEQRELPSHSLLTQASGIEAREAERPLRDAYAEPLYAPSHLATEPTEVLLPVARAPDLKPVDDQPIAPASPRGRRREEGEIREGAGMDDVVAAAVTEQMPEHTEPEYEGRQDPPAPGTGVEGHPRPDGSDFDSRDARILAPVPLPEGQIRHRVTVGGQALRKVPVPPLGPAHGVRKQAVVDQADTHGRRRRLPDSALRSPAEARHLSLPYVVTDDDARRRMSTIERQSPPDALADQTIIEVSVVIPCLNEAENIEECVRQALQVLNSAELSGEVLVVDNASVDGSGELAAAAGARVVLEPERGYGSAYLAGFANARGQYIVMADADLTYDFAEIPRFVEQLEGGADMVIGNRMKNIHPGAMPWHHRYIGNPLLSGLLNLLFRTGIDDAHCGMRAVRRSVLPRLDLRTTGMEFASEMVIRAAKEKLSITQFAIEYHPRGGESKLSSFRDGWRHLRFLLVHSPNYLFILPGAIMSLLGWLIELIVITHIGVFGREWDVHALIAGSLLAIVGAQVVALGICAHAYGTYFMGEKDRWFDRMRARYRLEHGLMLGGAIILVGIILGGFIVVDWIDNGFGALSYEQLAVLAATLIIVGIQVFFSSFLLSILGLRRRR